MRTNESVCARCGSPRLWRSRHRDRLESTLKLAGGRLTRYHARDARYLGWGGSLVAVDDARRAAGRVKTAILLALAAAALALALWAGGDSAAAPPDTGLRAPAGAAAADRDA